MECSEAIDEIIVTNTYPIEESKLSVCKKISVIDIRYAIFVLFT